MKNNLLNQDIKTDKPVPMSYEALKAERDAQQKLADALAVENAAIKDVLENICCRDNEPEYHDCGMGCGLEDRGITDRYRAMAHGWESAMERIYEEVIPFIEDLPETPATDAALAAIEARGVDKALAVISACRENICPGGLSENRQYEESIVQPHLDGIADELENLIIELREAK